MLKLFQLHVLFRAIQCLRSSETSMITYTKNQIVPRRFYTKALTLVMYFSCHDICSCSNIRLFGTCVDTVKGYGCGYRLCNMIGLI